MARLFDEHSQILSSLERLAALTAPETSDPADPTDRIVLEEIRDLAATLVHPTGHEAREVKILIPALGELGLEEEAGKMQSEHEELRARTERLKRGAAELLAGEQGSWAEVRSLARGLITELRRHIELEERELYPTALRKIREKRVWVELGRASEDGVLR